MLVGLLGKMGDTSAMQNIFGMLTDSANDSRVLDNPAALVGGGGGSALSTLSSRFTSTLFGTRASAVNDALAKSSGLKIGSISSLLQTAGPLVMAVLGKRVRDSGLNLGSFTRLLNDERDSIQRAAPPEVYHALGLEQRTPEPEYAAHETRRVEAQPRSTYAREPEPQRRSWFWPVAATIAALALLWGMWPRHREPNIALTDTSHTAVSGGEVVPSMPSSAPGAVAITKVILPSGDSINVSETSPEGRLVMFLRDPARRPDKTTWFVLDQAQFDQGSATLRPESDAQVANVALILKSFPNASVKIAGYADTTGMSAANKKLALARAEALRRALIAKGVVASHLAAEGASSAQPITDTSAMAGQAGNRRVALLVVRK
jgi:OmpA-OmpF porin, OOP family